VKDATSCVRMIEDALNHNDHKVLGEGAHGLKGICANVGATSLQHLVLTIEQAIQEGTLLDGPQTMEALQMAMTDIQTVLGTVSIPSHLEILLGLSGNIKRLAPSSRHRLRPAGNWKPVRRE
jgi:HPt (histidine-containing phosphotransfer) domain-containing protein